MKTKLIALSSSACILQSENGSFKEYFKNYFQIPPDLDFRIQQVYFALYCAVVASVVGVYIESLLNIGGVSTFFLTLWSIYTLGYTSPHQEEARLSLLISSAMFGAVSISHMIKEGFHVYDLEKVFKSVLLDRAMLQSILVRAFVGWNLAFGCFLAAAVLARHKEYLYWGRFISSLVFVLHFIFSISGGVTFIEFDLNFAIGGSLGIIMQHMLIIFADISVVYCRLLVTLLKNQQNGQTKKEEKRQKQDIMPKNEKNDQKKREEQRCVLLTETCGNSQ